MILENTITFSNNGISQATHTYKLDLYNIINNKTYTFEGNVTVDSDRFINISETYTSLIKGKYKGKLYINSTLFCTFIAFKEFSEDNKYRNNEERTKYVVE